MKTCISFPPHGNQPATAPAQARREKIPRDLARLDSVSQSPLFLPLSPRSPRPTSTTHLGVTPDVDLTLGRVDLLTGKVTELDLHLSW
jgi:hypothetical protein